MIELKNVSFSYNEVPALVDLNLKIHPQEFVSIVGSNGSGKSTLIQLLNGLLSPDKGEVLIDGPSGLLFQNPDNQIVGTIVEEDVAFGPENLGLRPEEIVKRINEALKIVKMDAFAGYEPHTLSAGQKQKVALASILAMKPAYLLLDEPTSFLDPLSRQEVLSLFANLNSKGTTVINVTHFPEQLLLGDRVIALDYGRVVFDGTSQDFFADDQAMRLIGFEKFLWMKIKERFLPQIKELKEANAALEVSKILCSLS